jgi:hypothetical protein
MEGRGFFVHTSVGRASMVMSAARPGGAGVIGDPAAADARIGRRSIRKNRGFPGKPGVSVEILNPRLNKPQVSTACHP